MKTTFPSHFPVTCHTKHVGHGSTFFALQGVQCHGETFINQAIEKGATKIVIDKPLAIQIPPHIIVEQVENGHQELALQSARALDFPANKLTIIGITGTKGKTSTAFLLFHLLQNAGIKTALLSTVENRIGTEFVQKSSMTTPTADFLQIFCAEAVKRGATHVIIEISAHALSYEKITAIPLSIVLFSNFGQDHLDFYQTMENYFLAKLKIFSHLIPKGRAIINGDDSKAIEIINAINHTHSDVTIDTVGQKSSNNSRFSILHSTFEKSIISFDKNEYSIPHFFGSHNCQNLAMACKAALFCNITPKQIKASLSTFSGIPGRLEAIALNNNKIAFVDYAHNPSSMESVLQTLAPHTTQLIVIFGCGGDKDRLKRPIMGEIASRLGQIIIITNDNPRTEDSIAIIEEIKAGIDQKNLSKVFVIEDRKEAICKGLLLLEPGGFLAILGKGHEAEQIIGKTSYPFDDRIIVQEASYLLK
jgi:UDP-N-acetylmuramoyl-L-alanyl-D-glutamate--2,6-diaminopimelate ligase